MKIIAINGSHRKGKNTALMLELVLEEATRLGAETELLEIADFDIQPCKSCNQCLKKPQCSIEDDMVKLGEKIKAADGLVLGSPVYFGNVSGRLKNFMDRTRWLYILDRQLEGRVGGALTCAGLRNGGQELTQVIIENFLIMHGFILASARDQQKSPLNRCAAGTMYAASGKWFRNIKEDELTVEACRSLGREIVRLAKKVKGL